MCFQRTTLPHGIPIEKETHDQFPDNVKEAWEVFHSWWKEANQKEGPVSRSSMPEEVEKAMDIILEAPIPGYDNATGADSCYMAGVQMNMVD